MDLRFAVVCYQLNCTNSWIFWSIKSLHKTIIGRFIRDSAPRWIHLLLWNHLESFVPTAAPTSIKSPLSLPFLVAISPHQRSQISLSLNESESSSFIHGSYWLRNVAFDLMLLCFRRFYNPPIQNEKDSKSACITNSTSNWLVVSW